MFYIFDVSWGVGVCVYTFFFFFKQTSRLHGTGSSGAMGSGSLLSGAGDGAWGVAVFTETLSILLQWPSPRFLPEVTLSQIAGFGGGQVSCWAQPVIQL